MSNEWYYANDEGTEVREGSVGSAGGSSPLAGVLPPSRPLVGTITPETAMSIGVVYRSVDILSTSLSQLTIGSYRNGVEVPLTKNNSNLILKNPNVDEPFSAFAQETVFSLALWGNAYWRIWGDTKAPASLEVLDPNSVSIVRDKNGVKQYFVGQDNLTGKVKHLKLQRLPGKDYGVGPVQASPSELYAAMRLKEFATSWFDVSGVPTGILTTDKPLTPEMAGAFAKAWSDFLASNGGTMVLSQGISYEPIRIKPAEAQFLEVQNQNNINIARLFGIPPMHLTVELSGTSNTYTNLEQLNILFIQDTLIRYMNEIENALSDFVPRGQEVKFKEEGLLRSDALGKWNVIEKQVGVGYTTGNELREQEGKAPLQQPSNPAPAEDYKVKAGNENE
jgi:HK97 family phage portal protein